MKQYSLEGEVGHLYSVVGKCETGVHQFWGVRGAGSTHRNDIKASLAQFLAGRSAVILDFERLSPVKTLMTIEGWSKLLRAFFFSLSSVYVSNHCSNCLLKEN